MLPEVLTSDQLSLVISQAAAPAFLLGAVASFLAVLVGHMSRIIDRARAINATPDQDPNKAALKATLPQLKLRAALVNRRLLGGRKRHIDLLSHDCWFWKCVLWV